MCPSDELGAEAGSTSIGGVDAGLTSARLAARRGPSAGAVATSSPSTSTGASNVARKNVPIAARRVAGTPPGTCARSFLQATYAFARVPSAPPFPQRGGGRVFVYLVLHR